MRAHREGAEAEQTRASAALSALESQLSRAVSDAMQLDECKTQLAAENRELQGRVDQLVLVCMPACACACACACELVYACVCVCVCV